MLPVQCTQVLRVPLTCSCKFIPEYLKRIFGIVDCSPSLLDLLRNTRIICITQMWTFHTMSTKVHYKCTSALHPERIVKTLHSKIQKQQGHFYEYYPQSLYFLSATEDSHRNTVLIPLDGHNTVSTHILWTHAQILQQMDEYTQIATWLGILILFSNSG